MKTIEELLFGLRDAEYAAFQAKLTPSVDKELALPSMRCQRNWSSGMSFPKLLWEK